MQLLINFFKTIYTRNCYRFYNLQYLQSSPIALTVTYDFPYLPAKRKDIDSVIALLLLFFQLNCLSTF